MNTEALQKGIAAHAEWKARVRSIINTGKSDLDLKVVKADNQCELGRWLYGGAQSATGADAVALQQVRQLHTKFHEEAARVIEAAVSGQRAEAEKAIALGGTYARASSALVEALVRWRDQRR
jgi:hypothetical protein